MSIKVFITTSGTGTRLGELTKHTNKALVRIGKKPAISYIIESYSKDTKFVITLGHKGEQVKDFLELAYPGKNFSFIWVDKYEGQGTSLGYSMLQAKDVLREPFIYHACDTIIEGLQAPSLDKNWAIGVSADNFEQYASFCLSDEGRITHFNPKMTGKSGDLAHVGIVGVHDYKHYWQTLERLYKENPLDSSLNDAAALSVMIEEGANIRGILTHTWLDIGNPKSLYEARAKISDRFENLDKIDEALFFFKDFVIKFFSDTEKLQNRVKRGEILGELAPRTLEVRGNFYKYEFVEGEKYSNVVSPKDLGQFLTWTQKKLWEPKTEVSATEFKNICRNFYEIKTLERIGKFLDQNNMEDQETLINGVRTPLVKDLLPKIDFEWLSNGIQTGFHGDFILENILKTNDNYVLLDWRQDFGGLITSGDMYYDLAKFYHNLVVNHDIISSSEFSVEVEGNNITLDLKRKAHLVEVENAFENWVKNEGLELEKIRILRAIIWLNMSPLHHFPFNIFLFYFGKYHLWQALKNK